MELVDFAAGGSGSVSAGLEIWSGVKNKHSVGLQSRGVSYKKPKKPVVVDGLVESSAGVSNVMDENVNSEVDSINSVSDLDNLENIVTEETSYVESDVSGLDNDMNNATPKKMHTCTYILNSKLPPLFFNIPSNGKDILPLSSPKFYGSNHLSPVRSCAPEKWNFNSSKLFVLDIKLSAIPGKTNGNKLVSIKKKFYHVDGFGGVSTPSKFSGIIRSTFTSEASMIKARSLAVSRKILVNDKLRKVNSHSNQKIVVKKIPVNLPRSAVESVFSKFVEFESAEIAGMVASKWSVFMSKNSVHVALATKDKQSWVFRDQHWALLYTLLVGTMTHDLSDLLESYDGKTCFIGRNPISYICNRCATVCFDDKATRLAAIGSISVFKGVSLHWAGLFLAHCARCEHFGHVSDMCSVGGFSGGHGRKVASVHDQVCLANIYKKKHAPVAHLISFGGKFWAQVASLAASSGVKVLDVSCIVDHLAVLEWSFELLSDQVSEIVCRLDSVDLVPLVPVSLVASSAISNMALDSPFFFSHSFSSVPVLENIVSNLSLSSLKVLTSKVGGLESKLMALDIAVATCNVKGINNMAKQEDIVCWHNSMNNLVSIFTEIKLKGCVCSWIANKFDDVHVFVSGLDFGHLGSGVAIIINNSLAKHMCKVFEIPSQLLSVKLLFRNKLSVSVLRLYAGTSLAAHFSQASKINSFIAKTVNDSSFVIFDGDFNEDSSCRCVSFKKCFDLGLVNALGGSLFSKSSTWCNSRGVAKTIDYMFVSSGLVNAIVDCSVMDVVEFFDTDHKAVSISVGLGDLLDMWLSAMHKQANKDHWKFDVKSANVLK
ncbi:hypothetical protein G9A89_017964 [Geosiphon pyriformis]|nr:hypothetical protein G9A89_017964 [Geosiphon pyriformis]